MAIKPIVKLGDPTLLQPSAPVHEFGTQSLQELVDDLRDTMQHYQGVGIAAPQIGVNIRVFIFGFEQPNPRYPNEQPVPVTVLANPSYVPLSNQLVEGTEGCLSLPGLRGVIPRYQSIQYSGFDINGKPVTSTASGFAARIIQHEIDHLDGKVFLQRAESIHKLGIEGSALFSG